MEIDHLRRALKEKSGDVATYVLQRHLTLLKESQLKVELDKLTRRGKLEQVAQKTDDLERQRGLLASYDFQIASLANEALELHRQITELEVEELNLQLQELRSQSNVAGPVEGTPAPLSKRIDDMTRTWLQKQSEARQLLNKESELAQAWKERFVGVQLQ